MNLDYLNLNSRKDVYYRHKWLNLISAHQVNNISVNFSKTGDKDVCVFDPFSGSGTTAYLASKLGVKAYAADVNPFLVWFGQTKSKNIQPEELSLTEKNFSFILGEFQKKSIVGNWFPTDRFQKQDSFSNFIQQATLLREIIVEKCHEPPFSTESNNLIWISFCQLVNTLHNFIDKPLGKMESETIILLFRNIFENVLNSSKEMLYESSNVFWHDSRNTPPIVENSISHVITSPPYPNKVSHLKLLNTFL